MLGREPSRWEVFRHLWCFAAITLDRVYLLACGDHTFVIETEGLEVLDTHIRAGKGVLLIGSHLGSFEALRALSTRRPDVSLRVVLDKQKTPAMTVLLEALAPEIGAGVIDASKDGASITLAMAEACRSGSLVALLADRGREHETLHHVPFLGRPAPFPVGPWLLAHTLQVPVMLCFGLYQGGNRYRLVFEPVAERIVIPRAERAVALDALIAHYATRLEHYARLAPTNWFNFYDFWQQDLRAPADAGPAGVGQRVGA